VSRTWRPKPVQQLQHFVVHADREAVATPLDSEVVGQLPDRLSRLEPVASEAAGDEPARVGKDVDAGELDLGHAAVPLMHAREQQLVGHTSTQGRGPVEPGCMDAERNVEAIRREADEAVVVKAFDPLVGVEIVV
jgi:hypothetical protein